MESTGTMALLVQHGADINSVEASTHLDQSLPYQWIGRLRRWDSHVQVKVPPQTGSLVPRGQGHAGLTKNAIPAPGKLMPLPSGAPPMPGTYSADSPGLRTFRPWRIPGKTREFRFAPLALAARLGHTKAARWLLENGADPEVPARDLCRCDNDEPMISRGMWYIPRQRVRPSMDQPHWSALHLAIHYGHDDIVQLLVANGSNLRQVCRSEDGPCSALHTAFIHNRRSIAESLLSRFQATDKISINARGRGGITPLHIGYCMRSSPLVDLALKSGADINRQYEVDGNQWTLFTMACAREDWVFALKLLRHGASPKFDVEREHGGRWTTSNFYKDFEDNGWFASSDERDLMELVGILMDADGIPRL